MILYKPGAEIHIVSGDVAERYGNHIGIDGGLGFAHNALAVGGPLPGQNQSLGIRPAAHHVARFLWLGGRQLSRAWIVEDAAGLAAKQGDIAHIPVASGVSIFVAQDLIMGRPGIARARQFFRNVNLIKPFQVFFIGVAFAIFVGLYFLLNKTSFGTAVRAIGDDEEVARIVGINTPVVIAVIFFLGGSIAGLGGIFLGEDIGIRPQMGLLLLLKGWIASVVGGIGNIYGALLGGFVLGMVENYGVWYIPAQWKDAVAFVLLIFFLSFWPRGLLPRR